MGMIWDGFDAFSSNFVTQVSGNQVRKSGRKSARSAGTRSV